MVAVGVHKIHKHVEVLLGRVAPHQPHCTAQVVHCDVPLTLPVPHVEHHLVFPFEQVGHHGHDGQLLRGVALQVRPPDLAQLAQHARALAHTLRLQLCHHFVEREVAVGQVVQDADFVPKVQHARPQLTRAGGGGLAVVEELAVRDVRVLLVHVQLKQKVPAELRGLDVDAEPGCQRQQGGVVRAVRRKPKPILVLRAVHQELRDVVRQMAGGVVPHRV
mmetsp:Transcript_2917/g.4912  ORF Transcript_2917/g.4912 Transcript_2917/m.4912 type:complete len:219 (-) Transcript_2917:1421-2077(-)